jgi:hypothetical protein
MGGGTSLNADYAPRQVGEEGQDRTAPQPLANHELAAGVDAVKLEHRLCQIETDRADVRDA